MLLYYLLRSWSHVLKAAIGQIMENKFCQSVQNPAEKEKKKKKLKDNYKVLCAKVPTQKVILIKIFSS